MKKRHWFLLVLIFITPIAVIAFKAWHRAGMNGGQKFAEPFRIAGNLYYVGANDVTSYLITGPQGHVLIDGGYFPLSVFGGRRLRSVRTISSDAPSIEFAMTLTTSVRTSSATTKSVRTSVMLRVPVATEAAGQAAEVVRRYQAIIDHR